MDSTGAHPDGSTQYRKKRPQQTTERVGDPLDLGVFRVYIERRNGMKSLYARAFIQGRRKGWSTGATTEKDARRLAAEHFWALHKRAESGESIHARMFPEVADAFLKWVDDHKRGEISDGQIKQYGTKWAVLKPYFEGVKITDIDSKFIVDLRERRSKETTQYGTPVKPSTLQKDLVFVRLVLKHAKSVEKCITEIPDFPQFRGAKFGIPNTATPYLTFQQYKKLAEAAIKQSKEEGLNPRVRRQREEMWAFIEICVGAALRVGEAHSIRWMDCEVVRLKNDTRQPAVRMLVQGKHFKWTGKREEAYGLYRAVAAWGHLRAMRPERKREDLIFLENHRDGIAKLLEDTGLRKEADGRIRTAKSLRHTGISLWLQYSEHPNIVDIAKWARTSVEQIQNFYDQNPRVKSVDRIAGLRFMRKKPTEQDDTKN
jgi:integrase